LTQDFTFRLVKTKQLLILAHANFRLVLQSSTVVFYRLLVLLQVYGAHD